MVLPSHSQRRAVIVFSVVALVALLGWCMWLPWEYPSSSMLYKFGMDRTLLLFGKMAGVAAVVLMIVQLVLLIKIPLLERSVGLDRLVQVHRWNGWLITLLVLVHPLLVFFPEDIATIPVKLEYWPEILGCGLLLSLFGYVSLSWWRQFVLVPYHLWKIAHRLGAAFLLGGALVHIYYVTDSFHSGPAYVFWVGAIGCSAVAWVWLILAPLWRGKRYVVEAVNRHGQSACEIVLKPEGQPLSHAAGQFAILHPVRSSIAKEPHPFTIASAPDSDELRFVIRCSGDWTSHLGQVTPQDRFRVDGPYGLFSPAAYADSRAIVCIAGGVGVTPMLSMIRSMGDDPRPLHLIWGNRTEEDVFCHRELEGLAEEHSSLQVTHVFSQRDGGDFQHEQGRVDLALLERIVGDIALTEALFFVCGPPPMMQSVITDLRKMGVPQSRIKAEVFGF